MTFIARSDSFGAATDSSKQHMDQNETKFNDHGDTKYDTNANLHKNDDTERVPNGTGYRNHNHPDIKVTWRNWLIAPICSMTVFGMVSSFYAVTEYTKHYFKVREFENANLSLDSNFSDSRCSIDPEDIYYQTETLATSEASKMNFYFSLTGGIPSVIAIMLLGSYTDALGRKFLLVLGITGASIRLIIAAVVVYFEANLYFILIACFIEGCTGQHSSIIQASLAYVADITEHGKKRVFGILYIECAILSGLSLATFVTGYVIDEIGYEYSMFISAGVLVLNFFIVIIGLPESFTKKLRRNDRSLIKTLQNSFRFFVVDDSHNSRWKYNVILAAHVLVTLSYLSRLNTETLYQLASPFCWSNTKVGVYAAVRTLAGIIIGMGSVKLLKRCLDDVTICMLGTISYGAAFFWTAFASDDITLYIIIAVGCFGVLSTTMQRAMLSSLTPPEHQGAIFTAVGVIESASFMISGVSTSAIYAATVSYMRGLVFLVQGSFDVASLLLLIYLKIRWHLEKKRPDYHDPTEKEITVGVDNYGVAENEERQSYRTSNLSENACVDKTTRF